MDDDLKNPYPEEFGFYRIGTPINADLCKAMPESPAFEMGKLHAAHCLDWSANPTSTKCIQAGGSDQRSQDASGYSVDVAANVNTPWVDATMSFHANQSWNHSEKHSSQTITAVARQETSIRLRANLSPDTLRACATADFVEHIDTICKAADALDRAGKHCGVTTTSYETASEGAKPEAEKALAAAETQRGAAEAAVRKALEEFYERYGTGFISKLQLGSLGVFQAKAQYDSSSDDEHANFGGSFSVSGYFGGVSAAAEYTKHHMLSTATGTVVCKTFCMPTNSKAASWVEGLLTTFDGQQLAKLGNLEAWQKPFQAPVAHAEPPKIKPRKPQEALAEFKGSTVEEKLQNMELLRMASEYKKTKGKEPTALEYRAWVADLRKIARNVNDVGNFAKVKPAAPPAATRTPLMVTFAAVEPLSSKLRASGPVADGSSTPMGALVQGGDSGARSRMFAALPPPRPLTATPSGDDVDFGEYGVIGYEYTPWEQVFPALKAYFTPEISFSKLTLAFAMAWLSSRQLLQQYLAFCGKWFPTIAPQGCKAAANAFRDALAIVSADLVSKGASSPNEIPERLELQLREALRRCRFPLMSHYDFLIEHFDWLRRLPFGAVPLVADHEEHPGRYYFPPYAIEMKGDLPQYACGQLDATDFPAPALLESNALRLYPVLCTTLDGKPSFFWANRQPVFSIAANGEAVINPKLTPGATVSKQIFLPLVANLKAWGMCNSQTGASLEEIYASRSEIVGNEFAVQDQLVTPHGETIAEGVWRMRTHQTQMDERFGAHLIYLAGEKPVPALSEVDRQNDRELRILMGQDRECDYSLMRQRAVLRGPFIATGLQYGFAMSPAMAAIHNTGKPTIMMKRLTLRLAPVDYADARIVGSFQGGGPMWTEPRSDRLFDMIRAWARQSDEQSRTTLEERLSPIWNSEATPAAAETGAQQPVTQ